MSNVLQEKLNMSLDDLVTEDKDLHKGGGGPGGRQRDGNRDRHGPYSGGRDRDLDNKIRGKGQGKGRRRVPPEDKALLNTHLFFNRMGDLVVRLHDTEVVTVRKHSKTGDSETNATQAATEAAETDPKPAVLPEEAKHTPAEKEDSAANDLDPVASAEESKPDEKPDADTDANVNETTPPADTSEKAEDAAAGAEAEAKCEQNMEQAQQTAENAEPQDCIALRLTSGSYRTVETKFIINEAIHVFAIRVSEGPDNNWVIVGGENDSRPFQDGMEIVVDKPCSEIGVVKRQLEDKMARARTKEDQRVAQRQGEQSDYRHGQPPSNFHTVPPPGWHPAAPPHYGGPPPPFGWRGPPPPGWGRPPWGYGAPPHGARPAHSPQHAQAGPPVRREPLPDSYFQ